MITAEATDGCTLITGGAGSGKTVVASTGCRACSSSTRTGSPLSAASSSCSTRCSATTSAEPADLLGSTRVDTFSAWTLSAITALTGKVIKPVVGDALTLRKKSSRLSGLLARYVREVQEAEPLQDLWRFYGQPYVLDALFVDGTGREEFLADLRQRYRSEARQCRLPT